jgi:hypothetical protein
MRKPEISETARILLENVFYTKILALEELDDMGAYSEALLVKRAELETKNFIELHPNGRFHVVVEDGKNNDPTVLIITNCSEDDVRNEYEITLDRNYSSILFEQLNESRTHKIKLDIIKL